MRLLLALLALPLAASTIGNISYTIDQCGANCPVPYYALPKPGSPKVPNIEQLRAFIGGPAGYWLISATDWRDGWTVGNFHGPSAYDGSFLFNGTSIICCKVDSLWITGVNDYGDWIGLQTGSTVVHVAGQDVYLTPRYESLKIDDLGRIYSPVSQTPLVPNGLAERSFASIGSGSV